MKTLRIVLLILIIIGIGLLLTQKIWVPRLVDKIITSENKSTIIEITKTQALSMVSNLPEVKDFIARVNKNKGDSHVGVNDITNTDDSGLYWAVQVYESLSDHNSTYAWYKVYVIGGRIIKES